METKRLLYSIFAVFSVIWQVDGQIISQYVETNSGTTPKGIEIWNNTGSALDFSTNTLVIEKGTNGGALSSDFTLSSGTLAPGEVIVIGTSNMQSVTTANGSVFHAKTFNFNGDDALAVKYGGVITDVFGTPGSDPGSAWSGGGVSTANNNIELLSGISSGQALPGFTDPSTRFQTVGNGSDLTGFGIAPAGGACSEPNTQASSFSASSVTTNAMTINWTRGDGDSVIVLSRSGADPVDADPATGTSYSADASFMSGDEVGTGNYVIYKGTGASVNATNLLPGTMYQYAIYEYNDGACYLTPALTGSEETTPANNPEPDNHPTAFAALENGTSQIDLSWTDAVAGTQAPNGYIIYAATSSAALPTPADVTDPSEDADLSDGSAVVKVAPGVESYSFTSLSSNTQYFFQIWSYTNSGANIDFKTSPAGPLADATTEDLPPEGLSLGSTNTAFVIDFDNTVQGINNGQYNNSGFTPSPAPGEINSNGIKILGLTDGQGSFGGTHTGGDFVRGNSTGGVTSGGIYAFEVSAGNMALGAQPTGSDFNPGSIVLKIQNTTGETVDELKIDYTIYVNNDQGRSNSFNFSHPANDAAYTNEASLDYTSPLTSDAAGFTAVPRSVTLSSLNIPDGTYYYLRWTSGDVGGGGSRDEFALDDITVTANPVTAPGSSYKYNSGWDIDPSGISAATDTIIVQTPGATISAATECGYLMVEAGATLDLGLNELTVNDTAFVRADAAAAYGQIIGEIEGTTVVESYWSSSVTRFFNMAFPVDATLNDISFDNATTLVANGGSTSNIYTYETATLNSATGEGSWVPVSNLGVASGNQGFSVYIGQPYFGSLPVTVSATGNLINGNVSKSISTANGGYNFIGNPYPSTLDWDAVVTGNATINNTYYILDDENGVFVGYNSGAGGLPAGVTAATQYIASGQAFFVNTSNPVQINFANDQRVLNQTPQRYKKEKNPGFYLTIQTENAKTDYVYVGFDDEVRDLFNPVEDGKKRLNYGAGFPNISIDMGGETYMYKFLNEQFTSKVIPVNFDWDEDNTVVMNFQDLGIDPDWSVELEDKLTGKMSDLRNSASYSFSHNSGNMTDRFLLHIKQKSIGTEENVRKADLNVYISEQDLYIDLTPIQSKVSLQILDLGGRLLYSANADGGSVENIALTSYANGIYILKVLSGNEVIHTQKISK